MSENSIQSPVLESVYVDGYDEDGGFFLVSPVWSGVDRTKGGGIVAPSALVERLRAAMEAGAVYPNPEIRTDVDGRTYVSSVGTVRGRSLAADLRKLGF